MEGWKYWEGKKVFVILKNKRQYQGKVILINIDKNEILVFITIIDKFGDRVVFCNSEIEIMKEEEER